MARPFSYPTVAALEVGQSTNVIPGKDVERKVSQYAKRNTKRFRLQRIDAEEGTLPYLQYTRMEVTEKYPAGVA